MSGTASGDRGEIIGSVENHRGREEGLLVYPVYARRSRGLSMGINLFPEEKRCSFDCPYCEVFPFKRDFPFSLTVMKAQLEAALDRARKAGTPVRDICFSGNGEPTLSPDFPQALEAAAAIRDQAVPGAALVLITNGSGLLDDRLFDYLARAALGPRALRIWLKLDAGTEAWYRVIDRSGIPFYTLTGRIRDFAARAPVILQTMICAVEGRGPSREEADAWVRLVLELASGPPGGLRGVQIYGKARPAPEDPLAEALPQSFLEARAASLRKALGCGAPGFALTIPVEVFP
jgi:histidinol dehydrogenase